MALSQADWLSTVSPSYAREIQTAEFGYGLESLLQSRQDRLVGIVNGIDHQNWDPAQDAALPLNYSIENIEPRGKVKTALQKQLDLPETDSTPLMAMVTRLDRQKGVDLAFEALQLVHDENWQYILLGTGSEDYEHQAQILADDFQDRVRIILRFDAELARRIYGGADLLLIPSRYEPCGLTQLIAMRYGCVPLVRETGGLKDTVMPLDGDEGTGFLFQDADAQSLASCIRQAIAFYHSSDDWKDLQLRCMQQNHSWATTAEKYLQLYKQMVANE
jgi:starch synthase